MNMNSADENINYIIFLSNKLIMINSNLYS